MQSERGLPKQTGRAGGCEPVAHDSAPACLGQRGPHFSAQIYGQEVILSYFSKITKHVVLE